MAGTETLTIEFKASGDKDLIAAFKGIAQAQKQVTAASKKTTDEFAKQREQLNKIEFAKFSKTLDLTKQSLDKLGLV